MEYSLKKSHERYVALSGKAAFAFFSLIQFVLVIVLWGFPQFSDQIHHLDLAKQCIRENDIYPTLTNLYEEYILAPGLINLLAVELKIFGSTDIHILVQAVMNIVMALEVFYIGYKIFNKSVGYIAMILFCLLYSNYTSIAVYGTEIPFTFFALSGFCLVLKDKLWSYFFAASFFFLSVTVRPLVLAFIIASIVLMVLRKCNWKKYVFLLLPYIFLYVSYGMYNESKVGVFVAQSTTGGRNFIMSTSEYSDGMTSLGSNLIKDPNSDIGKIQKYTFDTNMTFKERNSYLMNYSIIWVLHNPFKYLKQMPKKALALFLDDTWPERVMNPIGFNNAWGAARTTSEKAAVLIPMILKNIPYYIIMMFSFGGLWRNRKKMFTEPQLSILSIMILMICVTMVVVIIPRYHYPFMFVFEIYAASYIFDCIKKNGLTVKA